jgi:hypothetical protein
MKRAFFSFPPACRAGRWTRQAAMLIRLPALFLASAASVVMASEPQDWRLQLLEEEGLSLEEAEVNVLARDVAVDENHFLELIPLLGSEKFTIRANSQKAIERMGLAAKPWLDRLPEQGNPEISMRLMEIRKKLNAERQWTKSELLHYAVDSLVREKNDKKSDENSPFIFAELFRDRSAGLEGGYRHFSFTHDAGANGKVSDGVLLLSGEIPREGDQRLVLKSSRIHGEALFPDSFRIEVSLKSTPGGEGVHHIGVSIGNVRALFHPGYQGGGFRFEQVDTKKGLKPNMDMGFTPQTNVFATMGIDVERASDNSVKLSVSVIEEDTKAKHQAAIKVSADVIGALESISLDRSGRQGGDAVFDNLIIEMPGK